MISMGDVNSEVHRVEVNYLLNVLGKGGVVMVHNTIESVTSPEIYNKVK